MKWLLLVLITTGYVTTPIQIEFDTEELCLNAREHFDQMDQKSMTLIGKRKQAAVCLRIRS